MEENFKQDLQKLGTQYHNHFMDRLETQLKEAFKKSFDTILNTTEQQFLKDIYAYESNILYLLPDYVERYKNSTNNYFLYSLSHIPRDFHLEVVQSNPAFFDNVPFSEILEEVESKFIHLNKEVMESFEDSAYKIYDKLENEAIEKIEELESAQLERNAIVRKKR